MGSEPAAASQGAQRGRRPSQINESRGCGLGEVSASRARCRRHPFDQYPGVNGRVRRGGKLSDEG